MTAANFNYNGTEYMRTEKGYFYKVEEDKKIRIKQAEYEQAFDNLTNDMTEDDDVELEEFAKAIEDRKQAQAESDKTAEDSFNKKTTKKASKKRRSKDIAFQAETIIGTVTLTAKQVNFIKLLPTTSFYENGLESTLWCDCIAQDINWNPMSVGAMISTLREKSLVSVDRDSSRQGKPKYMVFTTVGQVIAQKLGLN